MFRILATAAALLLAACTAAPKWRPAALPQAEESLLESRHTGKTYRIQAAATGAPPANGYPVLYVLDGDIFFPVAAMAAAGMQMRAEENNAVPVLVVGVGYPGGSLLDIAARAQDYTPPSENYTHTGDRTNQHFGGAEAFGRFIEEELKPHLAARFAVNPRQQWLFGHSYGALYGLYALFNRPQMFQNYLIASPSVWWNQQRILQDLPAFAAKTHPQVNVRLTVGEYEQTLAPHLPQSHQRRETLYKRGMVRDTQQLGAALAAMPPEKIRAETVVYPKETHASSAVPAISDGLKWLYQRCKADVSCRPPEPQNGQGAVALH